MKLEVKDLAFGYNSTPVLQQINLKIMPGKVTAVIGPNAVGKSTLLKCLAGIRKPQGAVLLDGQDVRTISEKEMNRQVGYLTQENPTRAVLSVFEAVLLGRMHSLSWKVRQEELARVWATIEEIGIVDLAARYLNELSGGQKRMVAIAQTLVREPRVLLLDEPTSNLDLQHQLEVLELIRDLTRRKGISTLVTLHDLNMVARYTDELIILREGRIYAAGRPAEVLTEENIESAYGVKARVVLDEDGIPVINPLGSVRKTLSV